ncbi:MAG: hypothetical protein A2902_03750 [Elusimicrobia bacterium RIFCSPLOWO2_01_FULL_64_13]|nr:MAG: hypothetical protein A2902_03750 [Elusimicrobia bacterium RIFCSPLOWO2_01_FULL_64_13]
MPSCRRRLLAFFFLSALRGTASGLEVQPETLEFRGRPGDRAKRTIVITNNGPSEMRVTLLASWDASRERIRLSKKDMKLAPGRSGEVELSFKVPEVEGEIAGNLSVAGVPREGGWVESRSLHRIYLAVAGTERLSLEVPWARAREAPGGVRVEAVLRNSGNVHLQPKLSASIPLRDGGAIDKIFESRAVTLLPGETGEFSTTVPVEDFERVFSSGTVRGFFRRPGGKVENVGRDFLIGGEAP